MGPDSISAWANSLVAFFALIALVAAFSQVRAMRMANVLAEQSRKEDAKNALEAAMNAAQVSQAEYARAATTRAVELILHWTDALTSEMMLARKIGLAIKAGDEPNLVLCDQILVHPSAKLFLQTLFHDKTYATVDHYLLVPAQEVVVIRTWLVKYLNTLEAIMAAWSKMSVDKELLEQEFTYFVQGNGALDEIRNAFDRTMMGLSLGTASTHAGGVGSAYPFIAEFVEKVRTGMMLRISSPTTTTLSQ